MASTVQQSMAAASGRTVSEYAIQRIAADGIDTVFGVSGGGIMYLVDAVARSEDVNWIACHHEEFAGVAADGYARAGRPYGVAIATTGPGIAHLFAAVVAAWQDSSPVVFLAGQVKSADASSIQELKLRQNGTFEFDSLASFAPVTKMASIVRSAKDFPELLEEAIWQAQTGRPGPVLLEIPLDVQNAVIPKGSPGTQPPSHGQIDDPREDIEMLSAAHALRAELEIASRPLVLLGIGVVRSADYGSLVRALDQAGIPYVVTQFARQVGDLNHPLFLGSPGIKANRSANLGIAECDLLVAIGTSLHQQVIGWERTLFRDLPSRKIWFEVDDSNRAARSDLVDLALPLDAGRSTLALISAVTELEQSALSERWEGWRSNCRALRERYLLHYPDHEDDPQRMCLYRVVSELSRVSIGFAAAVTDAGIAWYALAQHYFPVPGSAYIASGSFGAMGMALPHAVGAAAATGGRVLALTGDGSLMMCLPELATLQATGLPVVLVVNSNSGYRSIRATQDRYFEGRHLGADQSSGVFIPSYAEIADAFRIDYRAAHSIDELREILEKLLAGPPSPIIVEAFTYEDQAVEPMIESRRLPDGTMVSGGLADMSPWLE